MRRSIFLLTASLAFPAAQHASLAAELQEGLYASVGDCDLSESGKTQCWITIGKVGEGEYSVEFVVADFMDASNVLCSQHFDLRAGEVEDYSQRTAHEGFVGEFGDNLVYLWETGGGLSMEGGLNNIFVCDDQFVWSGFYVPIGD